MPTIQDILALFEDEAQAAPKGVPTTLPKTPKYMQKPAPQQPLPDDTWDRVMAGEDLSGRDSSIYADPKVRAGRKIPAGKPASPYNAEKDPDIKVPGEPGAEPGSIGTIYFDDPDLVKDPPKPEPPKPEPPKHDIKPAEPQDLYPLPKDDGGYNGDYLGELRRSDDPLHPYYEEEPKPAEANPVSDHESALQHEMDDYEKWLKKGGAGAEQDWGPLLALIDSWTGSHILPGYQHPHSPLSEDDRRKMILTLKQRAVERDDKRIYNDANLKRMASATDANNAYRMAALEATKGKNEGQLTVAQQKQQLKQQLLEKVSAGVDKWNAAHPNGPFQVMDGNGNVRWAGGKSGSGTGGAHHRSVKKNAIGQLIDGDTGEVIDKNTTPAKPAKGAGATKGPKALSAADLKQYTGPAFHARWGGTFDKENPKHQEKMAEIQARLLAAQDQAMASGQNPRAAIQAEMKKLEAEYEKDAADRKAKAATPAPAEESTIGKWWDKIKQYGS